MLKKRLKMISDISNLEKVTYYFNTSLKIEDLVKIIGPFVKRIKSATLKIGLSSPPSYSNDEVWKPLRTIASNNGGVFITGSNGQWIDIFWKMK